MSSRLLHPSFEDLGMPLPDATFCIVDLETTGTGPGDEITEIGAVRIRDGELIGEFQTLVRPEGNIPASIQLLTGITTAMVAEAPPVGAVLGSFLEFVGDAVLVAHNARFDVGFLRRACEQQGIRWPRPVVVDTCWLARRVLARGDVPDCRLGTLARYFNSAVQPDHRALSDARATVDVLHGLLERVGKLGLTTVEDLAELKSRVSPQCRAKRIFADPLPERPGVYWFVSGEEVLYVGKSVNLKRRVQSYFTASEKRTRIHQMLRIASGVQHVECATGLEAAVRELRLIAAHRPLYNRRSKRQDSWHWIQLADEPFPRLLIVRRVRDGAASWGPFSSREDAEQACHALYDAFPLRRCTTRLSAEHPVPSCPLAEMGRCIAPCRTLDHSAYAELIDGVLRTLAGDVRPVLSNAAEKIRPLVGLERFEEADELKERLQHHIAVSLRRHRLGSMSGCSQIVAAAREQDGWAVHVFRYGKLAAAGLANHGSSPLQLAERLTSTAETVLPPPSGHPAGSVDEAEVIASWLETSGVRLIDIHGQWAWPLHTTVTDKELARCLIGTEPAGTV